MAGSIAERETVVELTVRAVAEPETFVNLKKTGVEVPEAFIDFFFFSKKKA